MLVSLAVAIKIISPRKIITRCLRKVSAPDDNHHPLRTKLLSSEIIAVNHFFVRQKYN